MTVAQTLKKGFSDFKSPYFMGLALLPFVVIFALFGYAWFGFGGDLLAEAQSALDAGQVPFLDAQAHPWITAVLTLSVFKWLFTIFFYLVGMVAVVLLSVVIAAIVIGFFTPVIVRKIHQKHYPDFKFTNQDFTFLSSIWFYIKPAIGFVILGLIALPFMFVPAVNFVAINIPFYYLFHNYMLLDVGSNIVSKAEFKTLLKKYKLHFRSLTATLYGFSLIPLLGVFLQVYYVIVLAHAFFDKATEERKR